MQSAFSINWPFVTWSGFDRDIYLANAFDRKELQRIKIVDE